MINLMTTLYKQIDDAHEHATYQGRAPQKIELPDGRKIPTPYPYVVYKILPIENTESNRDDYTLEVSCWDKSDSTSHVRIARIAGEVRQSLVNFRFIDDYNLIMTDRPSLGYVPDPDELIKRYDVTSTIRTYRR